LEKFHRVSGPYHSLFVLRNVSVDLFDERSARRPFTFDVREIGCEHDFVDTDMMPQCYCHALVLDAEIDMLLDVIAWAAGERCESQVFLPPADVALVP